MKCRPSVPAVLLAELSDIRLPGAADGDGAMKGAKRKGTKNEHRSRLLLEAAGYAVTRAAASLGAWDLSSGSARLTSCSCR